MTKFIHMIQHLRIEISLIVPIRVGNLWLMAICLLSSNHIILLLKCLCP